MPKSKTTSSTVKKVTSKDSVKVSASTTKLVKKQAGGKKAPVVPQEDVVATEKKEVSKILKAVTDTTYLDDDMKQHLLTC